MTVTLRTSADDALTAARNGIQRRAATRGFLTPQMQKADYTDLQLAYPHRLAFVQLDELLTVGNLQDAARIRGWRIFILESNKPIAAAHVLQTDQGELRLSELNEGQFVDNTLDALQIVTRTSNKSSGDGPIIFPDEILLLVAPALSFVSWWLKYDHEANDLVLPVAPTLNGLKLEPIPSSELIAFLRNAV